MHAGTGVNAVGSSAQGRGTMFWKKWGTQGAFPEEMVGLASLKQALHREGKDPREAGSTQTVHTPTYVNTCIHAHAQTYMTHNYMCVSLFPTAWPSLPWASTAHTEQRPLCR